MKIEARTSTRIDFAGGTLDLYPLYLFMDGGCTVNAGLSLNSHVEITDRKDGKIFIESLDLKEKALFDSIGDMTLQGPTSLIQRAIRSYNPPGGLNLTTRNMAPAGSGLGASSSLLMAISSALIKFMGEEIDITAMIDRGAAIEAAQLGIPTGKQDYYGAVLGGINALHFDEGGCNAERIETPGSVRDELRKAIIVSFTGISHFSGTNNWEMLKRTIEGQGLTREKLTEIKHIAMDMRSALIEHDLEKIGHCIRREWECRKQLADGVSNRLIDTAILEAERAGALGSKICGAGGGGCMVTMTPPDRRADVESALKMAGVELLKAEIDYDGLYLSVFEEAYANRG